MKTDKFGNELFSRRIMGVNGGQAFLISEKERELLSKSQYLNSIGNTTTPEVLEINKEIRKLRAAAQKMENQND